MAEQTLVNEQLTPELIMAGEEIIRQLDRVPVVVNAAFWFFIPEINKWRLMIASPDVRTEGPRRLYRTIQAVLNKLPPEQAAPSLSDITVLEASDPIVTLLSHALRTGPGISGVRFSRNTINGRFVEDAYIYRLQ